MTISRIPAKCLKKALKWWLIYFTTIISQTGHYKRDLWGYLDETGYVIKVRSIWKYNNDLRRNMLILEEFITIISRENRLRGLHCEEWQENSSIGWKNRSIQLINKARSCTTTPYRSNGHGGPQHSLQCESNILFIISFPPRFGAGHKLLSGLFDIHLLSGTSEPSLGRPSGF